MLMQFKVSFLNHGVKVHLIGKWNDNQEIPDPYKKDLQAFEAASVMIEAGVDAWQKKLWA